MSDTFDQNRSPEDETLAAEYVLGVLDAPERASAARRIAREPRFAAMVDAWQARLVPWTDDVAPVQPPPAVWTKISAALPAAAPTSGGLWQSLMLWRWIAAGAGALAVASLFALAVIVNEPAQKPLVAAIDGGGHHHFVATVAADGGSIAVVPAAYSADPTRVPELWLIAPGDKPRSLGILRADATTTIAVPAGLRARAKGQAVLAVSLEPPGGSTTGAPTGPVIAQGKLTTL